MISFSFSSSNSLMRSAKSAIITGILSSPGYERPDSLPSFTTPLHTGPITTRSTHGHLITGLFLKHTFIWAYLLFGEGWVLKFPFCRSSSPGASPPWFPGQSHHLWQWSRSTHQERRDSGTYTFTDLAQMVCQNYLKDRSGSSSPQFRSRAGSIASKNSRYGQFYFFSVYLFTEKKLLQSWQNCFYRNPSKQ